MDMSDMQCMDDDAGDSSPLLTALDQIRDLCDQLEAEQMAGKAKKPDDAAPADTAIPGVA